GISTESGIPDFRSPGGIWTKYDPQEFTYQNFVSNRAHRERYWRMSLDIHPVLAGAEPNAAHRAVAELERRGTLRAVITQNIDGLHQRAGSAPDRVIEIHGTALAVLCLSCGDRSTRDEVQARVIAGDAIPECRACGGILKPATVSFGQAMPERETALAFEHAERADVFLVIGSSLVVHPAAYLPVRAVEAGAKLIIVNLEPTPYDRLAAVVLHGKAGEMMTALLEAMA
ncbi:MAG TPA: Sir2 family NAD-dependent protein deacetylase, partial [Candidatus Binatia bacterium]|nr:Sir2 family NAD-dependent protein deacetylase [Candidatus Binatia bacterium]